MEINGINDHIKNELPVKESSIPKQNKQVPPTDAEVKPQETHRIDQGEIRIRSFMNEVKAYEERVSREQSFLENLIKAKKELASNKNVEQLYTEMIEIARKAQFNSKPLMSDILPNNIEFYKNHDNIKTLNQTLVNQIERARVNIAQQQAQINRYAVSIENIKASLSSQEIHQMQQLFAENVLYKNVNKEVVFSLIANK